MNTLEIKIGFDGRVTIPIRAYDVIFPGVKKSCSILLPTDCPSNSSVKIRDNDGDCVTVTTIYAHKSTSDYELSLSHPLPQVSDSFHLEFFTASQIHGLLWHCWPDKQWEAKFLFRGEIAVYQINKNQFNWTAKRIENPYSMGTSKYTIIGTFRNVRTAQFYCYCDYRILASTYAQSTN